MVGDHRKVIVSSKPTPKQPLHHIAYTSKHPPLSHIIKSASSSAIQKSSSSSEVKDQKRPVKTEDYKCKLPQFILPEPVKFNQEELVSFVSCGEC